jgi:hypothetical protein
MRSITVTVRGPLGIAFIALMSLRCSDALVTAPPKQWHSAKSYGALPSNVQFIVTAGPTSVGGGMAKTSTGVRLPVGAQARVIANGDLSAPHNPACANFAWNWLPDTISPHGTVNAEGAVFVYKTGDSPQPTVWTPLPNGGYVLYITNSNVGADTVDIWAQRKDFSAWCDTSDNPPVFTYLQSINGSTTLTIDVLAIDVTTSATTVAGGQSVTGNAITRNFPPGGRIDWSLDTAQFDFVSIPSCANRPTCNYVPPKSGRLFACVQDEYGTAICGYSPQISVIKCLTGDTLLDNPVFRTALLQALKDSKADSTNLERRREVGGWAYFDSLGLHVLRTENPNTNTPCSVDFTAQLARAVLIFHIHPFNPTEGFRAADVFPAGCGPLSGLRYDDKSFGGPSPFDWRQSVDTGKPSYVFDKKRVYVTDPSVTDSTGWRTSTKRYDWNTGKCRW